MNRLTMPSLILAVLISLSFSAHAQYNSPRNKNWTFGEHAGLSFAGSTPTSYYTELFSSEGCAAVSDTNGNLMFYTEGNKVYTRLHTPMTGGAAIAPFTYGTYSTTQGAQIVQVVGDTSKYYIFSLQEDIQFVDTSDHNICRLAYSIVDMTADAGLGAVISSGTYMDSFLSEKMIAVRGTDCNVWLLTHHRDSAIFYAWNITASGISTTPVVSHCGSLVGPFTYVQGVMKASPNGLKLAAQATTVLGTTPAYGTQLFDFDPHTGTVSNSVLLCDTIGCYGAEFSPDNSKLYSSEFSNLWGLQIYQYDISLSTAAAIVASKTLVVHNPSAQETALNLGPDGKIYITNDMSGVLDCIATPNVAGAGCGYTTGAITLSTGHMRFGLPNLFVQAMDTCSTTHPTFVSTPVAPVSFSVYPNPANGPVTLATPAANGHIAVTNLAGTVIYDITITATNTSIETDRLAPGIYLATWTSSSGERQVQKLTIK